MSHSRPVLLLCILALPACGTDSVSPTSSEATQLDDTGNADGSGLPVTNPDATDEDDGLAPGDDTAVGDDTSTVDDSTGDDGTDDDTSASDTSSTPDSDSPADDCPDELFVEPDPDPANTDYPDPALAARCEDGQLIVTSNGIIGYEFQAMTPNPLSTQNHNWSIPLEPVWRETTTSIPLLGTVGFSVTGLPIYGPNEGPIPDPFGDPVYNAIVDWCQGHTAQAGDYHLHAMLVECILDTFDPDGPSPIIGFAFDGYPIRGPRACVDSDCTEVIEVRSGWVQTGDPTTYAWDNHEYRASEDPAVLDECNGRTAPDGSYAYHATSTFPYILGCYHGETTGGTDGGDPGEGTGDPDDGGPPEPTTCTTTDDCAGACGDIDRCVCTTTPMGSRCVPGCDTAADCPNPTFQCRNNTCVPQRP